MKHKKGYFKGKYTSYLLTAYSSYQKSVEVVTDKQIASDLGVSISTYYRIKKGKQGKRSKAAIDLKEKLSRQLTYNNQLSKKGSIIYKAVEKIKRSEKRKKGIKELSVKEMNKLKKEKKVKVENDIEDIFEAHYEGES